MKIHEELIFPDVPGAPWPATRHWCQNSAEAVPGSLAQKCLINILVFCTSCCQKFSLKVSSGERDLYACSCLMQAFVLTVCGAKRQALKSILYSVSILKGFLWSHQRQSALCLLHYCYLFCLKLHHLWNHLSPSAETCQGTVCVSASVWE